MTDKIKKAQEAVLKLDPKPGYRMSDAEFEQYSADCVIAILIYYETILKALSAYEKLQGVDLDKLNIAIQKAHHAGHRMNFLMHPDDVQYFDELKKAARLVTDIGKDG